MKPGPPSNLIQNALNGSQLAMQSGQLAQSERLLRQALAQQPEHPALVHQLGLVAHRGGRNDVAVSLFQKATTLSPDQPVYWHNLAIALTGLGSHQTAAEALERCLQLKPGFVDALNTQGAVLRKLGQHAAAEKVLRRALKKDPRRPDVLFNLAQVMADGGQFEQAEALWVRVLDRQPGNAAAWHQLGVARYALGQRKKAESAYRKAIEINPRCGHYHRHLGLLRTVKHPEDADFKAAEALMESTGLPDNDRKELHFALAKMNDELGQCDRAFDHARQGNEMHHQLRRFDAGQYQTETRSIIQYFNGEYFEQLDRSFSDQRPVFIVGMTRSGTTLLEQMLCRHAQVETAGELMWIQQLTARRQSWPLPAAQLDPERADFIRTLTSGRQKSSRVIDKMPLNFRHLGVIATLFPQARVLHMRRNPLEVCRSNYFVYFAQGNFFANDLDDLGVFYGEYLRIMDHWRQAQPLAMHELDYEQLVMEPREALAAILEFLELPWQESCLTHGQGKGRVMTASAWQARQPLYTSSLDRARPYQAHLQPALDHIERVQSELGDQDCP